MKVGIVEQGWDPGEAGLGSEGGDCRAGMEFWGWGRLAKVAIVGQG